MGVFVPYGPEMVFGVLEEHVVQQVHEVRDIAGGQARVVLQGGGPGIPLWVGHVAGQEEGGPRHAVVGSLDEIVLHEGHFEDVTGQSELFHAHLRALKWGKKYNNL